MQSFCCHQKVTSLTELFENVKIDDVLYFLRETGLYETKDELKLINHVQTNEILLIENFTYKVFVQKSESNVYTYRQNLTLNNLQKLIRHKIQTTNHPTNQNNQRKFTILVLVCNCRRSTMAKLNLNFPWGIRIERVTWRLRAFERVL